MTDFTQYFLIICVATLILKTHRSIALFLVVDVLLFVGLKQVFLVLNAWNTEHFYHFVACHSLIVAMLIMAATHFSYRFSREAAFLLLLGYLIMIVFNLLSFSYPEFRPDGQRVAMLLQVLALALGDADHGSVDDRRKFDRAMGSMRRFNRDSNQG